MTTPRIYQNSSLKVNTEIILNDDAVQHVVNVLRLKPGMEIKLFNGDGNDYTGTLIALGKRKFSALITKQTSGIAESPCQITLGQAISRGEKMDYAIQKAVELGVHAIQPLITAHIAVKLTTENKIKRQLHWQSVAISACEQSGRSVVPVVKDPLQLEDWLPECQQSLKLVLDPIAAQALAATNKTPDTIALLIGPEGGLHANEIALTQNHGFQAVHLGKRILRTETATAAALAILQYTFGDLH